MPDAIPLDQFAPEDEAVKPVPQASPTSVVSRLRRLTLVLAALAVIEAVPAALWVHSLVVSPADAAAPAAPVPQPSLASLITTAPCAPVPVERTDNLSEKSASVRPTTASAPAKASGVIAGLVSISAPLPMHVYVKGRLIGTTEAESVMLPVGKHDLEFVSEAAGYRTRKTVTVQAGQTAKVTLEAPSGTVHVNATPWAEVTVDNRPVGETPIGNLKLPIGKREFVFRHPELGEHRASVLVTLKETARVSVNMGKK